MSPTMVVHITTLLVQAAGALLTAVVFRSFHRHYHRPYLRHWTRSWLALVVYSLGAAAALALAPSHAVTHPLRLSFAAAASVAGYLQIAWLLFGTYELNTGEAVPPHYVRRILASLVAVALLVVFLFSWDADAVHVLYFLRVGVRRLAVGTAFLIAALKIANARAPTRGLGRRIVLVAFVVSAAVQFYYLLRIVLPRDTSALGAYLGFVDFLITMAIAIGMVVWLLEDERRAASDAAARVAYLAYHDVLTGLPNRQLFLDRLGLAIHQAHREGHQLAVFFLDLDRFKLINDSLGHSAGDALLRVVADRLRKALRAEDTVTRLGGDEFTVLAPVVRRVEDTLAVARKVREALNVPIVLDGRELFVTSSIGIAVYPVDGEDAEALLKNADTAMYRAKTQGRDTVELYTASMNATALEQLALETSLRRAIAHDELVVYYQPIVDVATDRIESLEAVVRWCHPEHGLLPPDAFIPLAEATGLIVPIGEWVLRAACLQLADWRRRDPTLRIAVNLSVRQLQQSDFVARVSSVLAETGVPPGALELEVTESVAMRSGDGTVEKLRELKRLGVRISIDDFGTGYSSLSALRLFPADTLKIDRSFVLGMPQRADETAIARAVIALAHSLRLTVVAEGVEQTPQLEALRQLRCDAWQGFLLSPPVDAVQCAAMLFPDTPVPSLPAPAAPAPATRR